LAGWWANIATLDAIICCKGMEIILNEQMFKWIYSFRMSRRLIWQVLAGLLSTDFCVPVVSCKPFVE
jgi:hypothetical protein